MSRQPTERQSIVVRFAKTDVNGRQGQIVGRVSVYGNVDAHGDVVMPGAFAKTLAKNGGKVRALNQHDAADPIGMATLVDRPDALWAHVQLALDLQTARDTLARCESGLIDGFSIGYSVPDGGAAYKGGVRYLSELELWEVSFVTFPANDLARITDVKEAAGGLAAVAADMRRLNAELKARHDFGKLLDTIRDMRRTLGAGR